MESPYTHLFTPNLINQFNPGASWYSSIFEPLNYAQVQQTFPIVLTSGSSSVPFTDIGGLDNTFPQGRKVTQWQINDNLTYTRNKHTYHFGINTRRVDTSDYDLGEGTVPTVTYNTLAEFTYGAAFTASQNFPVATRARTSVGNLEYYAMDTYKPAPKITLTYGMRVTWNTNVTSPKALFSRMPGSFLDAPHSNDQPLNQALLGNTHTLFAGSRSSMVWRHASIPCDGSDDYLLRNRIYDRSAPPEPHLLQVVRVFFEVQANTVLVDKLSVVQTA